VGEAELCCEAGPAVGAGAPVTLAIRPEEIVVGPGADGGQNRLVMRICGLQFLGAFTRLSLALPGAPEPLLECDVAASALAELGAAEGVLLPLALPPGALRLFAAAS
jgi:iron(III) transport system ATP-binding protein